MFHVSPSNQDRGTVPCHRGRLKGTSRWSRRSRLAATLKVFNIESTLGNHLRTSKNFYRSLYLQAIVIPPFKQPSLLSSNSHFPQKAVTHSQASLFSFTNCRNPIGSFPVTSFTSPFNLSSIPFPIQFASSPASICAYASGRPVLSNHLTCSSCERATCVICLPRTSDSVFVICEQGLRSARCFPNSERCGE